MTTGSGGTGAVGDVLDLNGNNHEGDTIFTLGGSPTGKTLTLDFGVAKRARSYSKNFSVN